MIDDVVATSKVDCLGDYALRGNDRIKSVTAMDDRDIQTGQSRDTISQSQNFIQVFRN